MLPMPVQAQPMQSRKIAADLLFNQAIQQAQLSQFRESLASAEQALQIYQEINDYPNQANMRLLIGNIYVIFSQYDRAISSFNKSLEIARQLQIPNLEVKVLNNLGTTYFALGQYQKAIDHQQQALKISQNLSDRQGESLSLGLLGNNYVALGQYQKALDFYQQYLAATKTIGDRQGEAYATGNIGNTYAYLGQYQKALEWLQQSLQLVRAIADRRGEAKALENLGNAYGYLNKYQQATEVYQQALVIYQQIGDRNGEATTLGNLGNTLNALGQHQKAIEYLQQNLLDDRLEIILFSQQNLPIQRTVNITKDKLEALVAEFKSGLIDAGSEDYKEPAIALYKLLIKPIETELIQAQTILYAPDDILRYIPLSALNDGKQWLGEKYRISNLIAYTLSDFSPKPKTQPRILAGAFGGKAGAKKFGQQGLPATLKEVIAIANSFQDSFTLIEDDFSRANTEAKFNGYNILHFATHAEFNDGVPENSFIIFGNGDKVRLNELTTWQIPNVELLVLSACQTGVGKLGSGVEILGFGYQIQKAGAKQAIASFWSVDDVGTQALMEAFYKELKTGNVTTAEALHRAQISLIKSSQFNHPKYWSAFFVIGNGL
jgi:CHAT domain-containing protein